MAKKEFSFAELDKALSKIDGFEMGSILENNDFSLAYQSMKDLQKISEAMNTKMNDGDEQIKIENFI
jgi:hypothetical protein